MGPDENKVVYRGCTAPEVSEDGSELNFMGSREGVYAMRHVNLENVNDWISVLEEEQPEEGGPLYSVTVWYASEPPEEPEAN